MNELAIVHNTPTVKHRLGTRKLKKRRKQIMNKLFTKIAGVALGLTLAIGVGVAVSASVSRKTVPTYAFKLLRIILECR